MVEAYKLFSQMQLAYMRYKRGDINAKQQYNVFVNAATQLMELGVANPFEPNGYTDGGKKVDTKTLFTAVTEPSVKKGADHD